MDETQTMGGGVDQAPLISYPSVQQQPATTPAVPVEPEPAEIPTAQEEKQGPPAFDARPWEEVAYRFKTAFPTIDPKEMERDYNAARQLAMHRRAIAANPPNTGANDVVTKGLPFSGPVVSTMQESEYKDARQRVEGGHAVVNDMQNDYQTVAVHERMQADRGQRSGGANFGLGMLGAGRFVAEAAAGGAAGKVLGLGVQAASWLGLAAASGPEALQGAAERASGKEDDTTFLSPSNIVPSTAITGLSALVMGGAGKWAQGIANPLTKFAAEVGGGFAGLQGVEVAAGAVDEFLAPAWKTNTKYGVIGKLVNGERGPALQETVSEILTIAALSFLHSQGKKIPDRLMRIISESIDDSATGRARPEPEPPPRGGPGGERAGESTWDRYEREQEEAYQRRQRNRRSEQDSGQQQSTDQAAENLRKRVNATAEEVLGVKPDATMEEITRAYRKRAQESHPDRGGTSDEFQWVDWAYKTLQARANPAKRGPKSRPRGQYDPAAREAEQARAQQQPPPYESQEPPEPTAKTAAGPGEAPGGPPASPVAETAEAPPAAQKPVPEIVPEGIKARMEDLVKRRAQARAVDDFETEMQTGRDISDLVKEYPRLTENQSPKTAKEVAPVGKAFSEAFPGAQPTPRENEWRAEFGGRTIYAMHDPATNSVRLDFSWTGKAPGGAATSGPKANIPTGLQPGSKEMLRSFGKFAQAMRKTGTSIEYTATDSRAGTYRRMMERSGFEQAREPSEVSPGTFSYSWKPKQTPREKVDGLTEQLRVATANLSAAKALESKELLSKGMGLKHRADEVGAARKEWASRVKTLQGEVDEARDTLMRQKAPEPPAAAPVKPTILERMRARQAARTSPVATPVRTETAPARAPKEWATPHEPGELMPTIDQLHDIAGLSPVERELMHKMFVERTSVDKLAEDPKYGPRTGGGIHAMSVRLLAKMGYKGTVQQFFDKQKEILQKKIAKAGETLEHGAIGGHVQKGEAARKKLIHRVTAKEALGNRWAAHIGKLYEDGPLSADEVSSINEAISRGENPPGYDQTPRGRKLAAKRAAKAPVPSGPGTSVRPDNPPEPAGEPEPGTPAPAVSTPVRKLTLSELNRRSKAPPEVIDEAQRMGIDLEHLHHQAKEVRDLDKRMFELKHGALQLAKKTFAAMAKTQPMTNLGDFKTFMDFRKQVARGKVDASMIRGLDLVARSVGNAYPELFDQNVDNESGWDETLFNMFVEGNPTRISEAAAYKVAIDYLADLKEATTPTPEMLKEWNDELKASHSKPLTEAEAGEVQRSALEKSQRDNAAGQPGEVPNEDADSEIAGELFDDSFNVDEFAAFGDNTGPSGPDDYGITTAGADRPTESDGPEPELQPGSEGGLDDRPDWAKRMEGAPPGTQANLLPGSFGSLTGTQGELFDRTPIEKTVRPESMPGQTNFLDQLADIANDLAQEEGGAVDLERIKDAAKYAQDTLRRLQGQANPATTRIDPKVAEALMRWMVADQWGEEAAPYFVDLVAGKNATTAERIKIGAMLTEMRLGFMRAAYRRLGNTANVRAAQAAANRARVALRAGIKLAQRTRAAARGKPIGSPEQLAHKNVMAAVRAARRVVKDLERKARTIGRYNKIANNVESIIGKPGSPFQTHREFFAYRDSPEGRAARQRWVQHVVPVMESLYKRAMGRPPASQTQIPGMPVNLMGVIPGQTLTNRPGVVMTSGGPKRLKTRKYVHAEQAKGNAPGYHTDLADILTNTFRRGADIAARNQFFRAGVQSGGQVLQWVKAGTHLDGYKEVPFTTPQGMKGSLNPFVPSSQRLDPATLARPGTTLRVIDSAHGEVMNGFNSDTPNMAVRVLRGINQLPLMANLASAVDAASHGLNLGVGMTAPSGRPFGMVRSAATILTRKIMGNPEIRKQLLEMTRIGANKRHGHGKGMIVDTLQKGADILGKQLPEKAQQIRYVDPTYGLGQLMQHASDVIRLALNEAFDMHVKNGALDTETNRRDFINQWGGAYERKAMNWMVKQFTDTGFGPFAVAGVTMNSRAAKALIGDPSIKGGTWKSTARLRMEFIAKMAAVLALGAVVNWMRWGRIDGDDNTPRFGLKIGEGTDGKTKSLPNPVGMLLNRGMRAVPFLSYFVDKVFGTSPPSDAESKVYDVVDAWMHPFMGPTIQFAHTAITGKDTLGKKIAAPAGEEGSVPRENVKAALKQANPIYSALSGAYKPGEEIPISERLAKIMGPFGFKYTEKQPKEIADLYDLGHRLRELQDVARGSAKKQGEVAPRSVRLNVIQRVETAIGKLERQRHAPGLSQEARQAIRADEVELAKSALAAAKELKGK